MSYANTIHIEAAPAIVTPLLEALGKDIHTGEWAQRLHALSGGAVRDRLLPEHTSYSVHAHGIQAHVLLTYQSDEQLCWLTNTLIEQIGSSGLIEVLSTDPAKADGWWFIGHNGTNLVNRAALGFAEADWGDLTFIRWEGGVYTVNNESCSFEDAYALAQRSMIFTNWSIFQDAN